MEKEGSKSTAKKRGEPFLSSGVRKRRENAGLREKGRSVRPEEEGKRKKRAKQGRLCRAEGDTEENNLIKKGSYSHCRGEKIRGISTCLALGGRKTYSYCRTKKNVREAGGPARTPPDERKRGWRGGVSEDRQ